MSYPTLVTSYGFERSFSFEMVCWYDYTYFGRSWSVQMHPSLRKGLTIDFCTRLLYMQGSKEIFFNNSRCHPGGSL